MILIKLANSSKKQSHFFSFSQLLSRPKHYRGHALPPRASVFFDFCTFVFTPLLAFYDCFFACDSPRVKMPLLSLFIHTPFPVKAEPIEPWIWHVTCLFSVCCNGFLKQTAECVSERAFDKPKLFKYICCSIFNTICWVFPQKIKRKIIKLSKINIFQETCWSHVVNNVKKGNTLHTNIVSILQVVKV